MHRIRVKLAAVAIGVTLSQSALAMGYSVKTLTPLTPQQPSLSHLVSPSGATLGESMVSRRCPISQLVGCLVDGYTAQQPRSLIWPADGKAPIELACLDTTLAPSASWDKPCEATGINSKGVMVGRSYAGSDAMHTHRPVMWRGPTNAPQDLTPLLQSLPAFDSARAVGINEQGWILGRARLSNSASGSNSEYAFLLRDGLPSVLPAAGATGVVPVAINNTMAIGEGRFDSSGQSGVIIWTLGGATTTLRAITSAQDHIYAAGLSSAGHVTGAYWAPLNGSNTQGYVWYQGRAQALPTDANHDSRGHSVNALGQVVGNHCQAGQDLRGCRATLWTNGVKLDLNKLVVPPKGYTLVDARSINDQGQITGWMVNNEGLYRGFTLTMQP